MPIVGWVVLQFSDTEVAFRSAAIVLSIGAAAAMWFTGRTMFSPSAAWIGTAVFVASASYLRRATEFLNDLAAAGFLIATMLVIWYYFERRPQSWWLLACAPLAAGAYYMRYGSALGLVVIGLFTVIIWARRLLRSWRQILATAAATLALLVPHFAYAIDQTGSVFGVFRSASTSVGGGGGGLGQYIEWLPRHLAGRLGAAVMLAGVIYAVVTIVNAARSSPDSVTRSEARTVSFLTGVAISLTIALGVFTHGEPRFVFMPLMAILLVGGQALVQVASRLRRTPRLILASLLALVVGVVFAGSVERMSQGMDRITGSRDVIVEAADAVRIDVGQGDCFIRSSYVPQLTWYAVCATYTFSQPAPASDPAYLVLFENGKRQPAGADLDTEIAATDNQSIAVVDDPYDKIGDGYVFRYPSNR
jgi:4-amino-4-deoxy-L-arabinose transferase-like glycosyltransferase